MGSPAVVDDVRRVFGDVGALAERLEASGLAESPESLGGAAGDPIDQATALERSRVLGDGLQGLEKLAEGREADLDDDELLGLEAIVLVEGRPAILVEDGDFAPPPPEWARLTASREQIRGVIARSGRVELTGHLDMEWSGTASLVGPRTLMTNRHVALEFCSRRGEGWAFRPGISSRIDFSAEHGRAAPLEFEITEAIGIHEDHDLALLRVDGSARGGDALPDPLAVAAAEPEDLYGRDVYAVGHPAEDSRRNDPETIRRLFRDIYDVKRLQPGKAVAYSTRYTAVQHDCSTLGGNSGSPLVDLDTHRVVGLHFGGSYRVGNYAVPLWTLTGDPLMKRAAVNFQ